MRMSLVSTIINVDVVVKYGMNIWIDVEAGRGMGDNRVRTSTTIATSSELWQIGNLFDMKFLSHLSN